MTDYQKCKKQEKSKQTTIYINLINVQHCIHFCATRTVGSQGWSTEMVVLEGAGQCCHSATPPLCRESQGQGLTGRPPQTLADFLNQTTTCECVRVFLPAFLPFHYLPFVVFWLRLYNWRKKKNSYFSMVVKSDDIFDLLKNQFCGFLSHSFQYFICLFIYCFSWWKRAGF